MRASHFAFFMNLPTLLCLGLVLAYPISYAAYLSVHRVGLGQLRRGEFPFNGWENYGRVLEDPLFWVAMKNTLMFTAITVISEIVLAVAIALLINQTSIWTSRLTRFLILLPYAIPPICNGLIWSFLYSFQFGFLNRILFSLGLISDPVNWAGNPDTALYAVTVPYIWRTLPFAIILVHAALQGIPRELYEQAAIDGANAWHRFTKLARPMLHVANLMVIFFILLPVVAVFIGSIQSEKALQADTRRVLPLEVTLDNFLVILSKGEQKGRIFDQVTYLPDNIKNFYVAFA